MILNASILLYRFVTTIVRDIPVRVQLDHFKEKSPNESAMAGCAQCGFRGPGAP